jgi:hypothetical protein
MSLVRQLLVNLLSFRVDGSLESALNCTAVDNPARSIDVEVNGPSARDVFARIAPLCLWLDASLAQTPRANVGFGSILYDSTRGVDSRDNKVMTIH